VIRAVWRQFWIWLVFAFVERNKHGGGADFVVRLSTRSKEQFGPPLGLKKLSEVCDALGDFPVLALGGVSEHLAPQCLEAGASGIAGIGLFSEPENLRSVVAAIRGAKGGADEK
jgi:thiamine monophosphate synthase